MFPGGEELFDDPILERVKRDHGEPPARSEPPIEDVERRPQISKFVVNGDPQSLERPRGEMQPAPPVVRRNDRGDDLDKFERADDVAATPRGHHGLGDAPGVTFFAVLHQDLGQVVLAPAVDDLRGRQFLAIVEPHVERPVEAVAEPAQRIVDRQGRKTQIEKRRVNRPEVTGEEDPLGVPVVLADKHGARTETFEMSPGRFKRRFVKIEPQQSAVRRRPFEDRRSVTAGADRAIDDVIAGLKP